MPDEPTPEPTPLVYGFVCRRCPEPDGDFNATCATMAEAEAAQRAHGALHEAH